MTSNYTLGPWIVGRRDDDGSYEIVSTADTTGRLIAMIEPIGDVRDAEHARQIANARLIAAAPALLKALEAITNTSVGIDEGNAGVMRAWSKCCAIARAAIAKAKGE